MTTLHQQILAALETTPGGMTSRDLARQLRCPADTIRRRLAELHAGGVVAGTGAFRRRCAVVAVTAQLPLLVLQRQAA